MKKHRMRACKVTQAKSSLLKTRWRPSWILQFQKEHVFFNINLLTINPFSTKMHSKMRSTGEPVDNISEYLFSAVIEISHLEFFAVKLSIF